MTTVTGLTAERMLEIEAASVVDGDIVGDDLFLTRKDGTPINAGNVRGPRGADGPMGHSVAVLTAQQVLDVGIINQIRAGRQLTPADFTSMGLSAPLGLWNLSTVADSSGNGRNLTNRGAVPFAPGINGAAATSAAFAGSAAQSLYIADSGGADPFRIKTGSWGCWFRTARRGVNQRLISKITSPGAITDVLFDIYITSSNVLQGQAYAGGAGASGAAFTDVADDRWHFVVVTADGSKILMYLDSMVEATGTMLGPIAPTTFGPLNIGSAGDAGAGGIASVQTYGRVDEAFVTADVLSAEQVRNLYCASIPHALAAVPASVGVSVRRRRRGGAMVSADFPAQPVRLYNFTAGALTDQGSANVPVAAVGGGTILDVAGAAGLPAGAKAFAGAHTGLGSTDAGLPAALTARSYGLWFKTTSTVASALLAWGGPVPGTGDIRLLLSGAGVPVVMASGADLASGPSAADGLWHFAAVVEDNAAADGVKRKLYFDGRLGASSTVMNSIALAGANRFRIGANEDGSAPFTGQIDGVFVYAGALTYDQIRKLYDVGSQLLPTSPKDYTDHIETLEAARMLGVFDTIESCDSIDMAVFA